MVRSRSFSGASHTNVHDGDQCAAHSKHVFGFRRRSAGGQNGCALQRSTRTVNHVPTIRLAASARHKVEHRSRTIAREKIVEIMHLLSALEYVRSVAAASAILGVATQIDAVVKIHRTEPSLFTATSSLARAHTCLAGASLLLNPLSTLCFVRRKIFNYEVYEC